MLDAHQSGLSIIKVKTRYQPEHAMLVLSSIQIVLRLENPNSFWSVLLHDFHQICELSVTDLGITALLLSQKREHGIYFLIPSIV